MYYEASRQHMEPELYELLRRVEQDHDSLVLTREGKPIAAVVDFELFRHIQRMLAELTCLNEQLADLAQPDTDLNHLQGSLRLREDPLAYQQRIRGEWQYRN